VWNAFRLGNFALKEGDDVEVESLVTDRFKIANEMRSFVDYGGQILACGTCLKIRDSEGSDSCPVSTMKDLYEIVKKAIG
jgi:uncharacterized protein involved in oxidation of intracellular sulfur